MYLIIKCDHIASCISSFVPKKNSRGKMQPIFNVVFIQIQYNVLTGMYMVNPHTTDWGHFDPRGMFFIIAR